MSFSFNNKANISQSGLQKEVTANTAIEAASKYSGHLAKTIVAGTQTFTDDESLYGQVTLSGALAGAADYSKATGVTTATLYRNATTGGQVIRVRIGAGTYFAIPAGGWVYLLSTTLAVVGHSDTAPTALGTAAVVGTSEAFARSDHKHPRDVTTLTFSTSNTAFTNVPAALQEWGNDSSQRQQFDLTLYTQFRFKSNIRVVATAGTLLRVQYSTNGGGAWNYLDDTSEPSLAMDVQTLAVSAWGNLATNAKADVLLRVVTIGGDGATAPIVGLTTVEFR